MKDLTVRELVRSLLDADETISFRVFPDRVAIVVRNHLTNAETPWLQLKTLLEPECIDQAGIDILRHTITKALTALRHPAASRSP